MSGFQTYLDNAERHSGVTPRQFLALAHASERGSAKPGQIVTWLKADFGLGHGHAGALAQLITRGPDAVAAKYNDGVPLRLDGVATGA